MNPDGGWRTRHLRLRSSCLRELLKNDPLNWKVRHQKGTDLSADMLTKPIVLQRDWVKFWHFLGFHVDFKGAKGNDKMEPVRNHEDDEQPCQPLDAESTEGIEATSMKIKVLATLAAMAVVAAVPSQPRQRVACAAAAAACAGWLVSSACSPKSIVASDSCKEVEREEKNLNEESKDQRATGHKKMRKIGAVTREIEEKSSQGKMNLRTKMEDSSSACSIPPNPKDCSRENLGSVLWDDDPELFREPPKEVVGQQDGQVQHESWTQLCSGPNLNPWSEAIGYQHYCPSGCPNPDLRPRLKAMSFRHGVAYADEISRDGALVHGHRGFAYLHLERLRINGCILRMKVTNIGSRCITPFAPRNSIQCTVDSRWTWTYWSR